MGAQSGLSPGDPRQTALDVLLHVDRGAASDRALDRALRASRLDQRDRALATELVYGVLRRRLSLDRRIASHSRRPLAELDTPVLEALRLGAYQLAHLDRVPPHAAVDATVNAVKAHARGAAGFVNAVLRTLVREGRAPEANGRQGQPPGADGREAEDGERRSAAFADVPEWWAARWRQRYGDEVAGDWFASTLAPSPLVLRPHPRVAPEDLLERLAGEGIELEGAPHAPGALRAVGGSPVVSPLLHEGAFTLRGEASQLVAALLPLQPADRVLDVCAGRGGKTLQIAEDTRPALLVASDISPWRVAAARRDAIAAHVPEIHHVVADLSVPAPFARSFSAVLVDAPCSGLGTVRRRPELKWRNDVERLRRLAALQRRILDHAVDTLVPGGLLLYATCSTEPEENEDVVDAVLDARTDLERRPVPLPPGTDARFVADDGYFRTYPLFDDLDGFFAALLAKTA